MKLYVSNTSLYVRKVRIKNLDGGYRDKISFFEMATDDGQKLFDS